MFATQQSERPSRRLIAFILPIAAGGVAVFSLGSNKFLRDVDVIHLGMPVDNLSVDENGDIWAAAFSKVLKLLGSFGDPYKVDSPTTLWRIRKVLGGYVTEKVLENADAVVLGGATVVRHDVKTGKLFIGGKVYKSERYETLNADVS